MIRTNVQTRYVAFSLVEVVLALGVIAFAVLAILGVLPIGLQTGHSAQDETRAAQIARDILDSIASQAAVKFPNATIKQAATTTASDFSYDVVLDGSSPSYTFSADNDGHLVVPSANLLSYPYEVSVLIAPNPSGFDSGYASTVTVRIISPPSANPGATPAANQTVRDYVRIISKY